MSASPETFIVLGIVYFVFMMVGAAIVRVPPPGWKPEGYVAAGAADRSWSPTSDVYVYDALKTPQFWLIWMVLCLNVTAGIGVLGQASAMSQEMFPGRVTAGGGGRLRRADQPVQHGRPVLLGLDVGLYRPQEHLLLFFVLGTVLYSLVP